MAIPNISLETANRFYEWGWRFSIAGAVITAISVWALMWGTRVRDRDTEGRIANLNLQAAQARERTALTEERLLAERRLTANERWRLERLERAVLPRNVTAQQRDALLPRLTGLGPVNVAIVNRPEPMAYGLQLVMLFQQAGIMHQTILLPSASNQVGVVTYAVNEHGRQLAERLWEQRIGGAVLGVRAIGLEVLPANENTLIVGENNAALQPGDGQPGEGIDEHGGANPAP